MVGEKIGKYRVSSRVGRGGMGTVYRAVDESLHRDVAIKCLNPGISDADILRRFEAEAQALARLNHPNIATLFELTEHEGQLLMVMEFVAGETFEQLTRRSGPMKVETAAQLCGQVLDALEHAHRAGVVHRDLKPANLMLSESGVVKVMDFGLARMSGSEHVTNHGFMVGTPAYMAPEQVAGSDIDGRADLYALAIVLYRLLTTRLPFEAESGIAMVHKQVNDPPTPIRQLRDDLPALCEAVLAHALAKLPADRYQSAPDFRSALVELSGVFEANPAGNRVAVSPASPRMVSRPATPIFNTPDETVLLRSSHRYPESRRRARIAGIGAAAMVLLVSASGVQMWRALSEASLSAPVPPARPEFPAIALSMPRVPDEPGTALNVAVESSSVPAPAVPMRQAVALALPPAVAFPVFTLEKVRLLVFDADGKPRDRAASLRLSADAIEVVDGATPLERSAYRDVTALYHSHSREPRWITGEGATVSLVNGSSRLAFLKPAPDWITVRTDGRFIPIRIDDRDLQRVVSELEKRTETRVVNTR